jgi:hypothetical protein
VVVAEFDFESMDEREAWWESWSGSTLSQREWGDERSELVERGARSKLWTMDKCG